MRSATAFLMPLASCASDGCGLAAKNNAASSAFKNFEEIMSKAPRIRVAVTIAASASTAG
jgi:hypothetical protein